MDADFLALLLDLAIHRDGTIEPFAIIILNTGRGRMGKAENIIEESIGVSKCQGLL